MLRQEIEENNENGSPNENKSPLLESRTQTLLKSIKQSRVPELVEMTKDYFLNHRKEIDFDKKIIVESAKLNDTTLIEFFCNEFKEEFNNKKNKFVRKLLVLLMGIPGKMKTFEIIVRSISKNLRKKCKRVLEIAISSRNIKFVEILLEIGHFEVTQKQFLDEFFDIGSVEMMKLFIKHQKLFELSENIDDFIQLSLKNKNKRLHQYFLELKNTLEQEEEENTMDIISTPNQNQADLILEEELRQTKIIPPKKRKLSQQPMETELEEEISNLLSKKMKK